MTTVTDEILKVADVQLVTEFNSDPPPPQLVLMALFRYLLLGKYCAGNRFFMGLGYAGVPGGAFYEDNILRQTTYRGN